MWIVFALLSAFFAGITAILAKVGVSRMDSDAATALRTTVVLVFAWIMAAVSGGIPQIPEITGKTFLFLVLSGAATGASWLCYFRALQLGNVNKVAPLDKMSTPLAVLFAFLLIGEVPSAAKIIGVVVITAGTLLMLEKKDVSDKSGSRWLIYALLSAVFAAMTSILGKIGIESIESNLGTAIRTTVVLVFAWSIVLARGKTAALKSAGKREYLFLTLSGISTGGSWLCYYRALQIGEASLVVPIDKLSIVVTVILSWIFLHEKLKLKSFIGLALIVAGTLIMLIKTIG